MSGIKHRASETSPGADSRVRPALQLDCRPAWSPCANPHIADFLAACKPGDSGPPAEPFTADVKGTKGSPAYRAHMYHTKVPPEAIEHYVEHYTAPGETVMDPFCGSGMTGVAALRLGRRAILSDLSPLATFLAYNNCQTLDPLELREMLEAVLEAVRGKIEPAYRARCPRCGRKAGIKYVIWSDRFRCPDCRKEYLLWDAAIDGGRRVLSEYPCPSCGRVIRKKLKDRTGSRPAAACLDCPNGCDVKEAPPGRNRPELFKGDDGDLWHPADEIPEGLDELSRVRRSGVKTVADLFTARNLRALTLLWAEAAKVRPARLRARALFAVTAIMVRASRLVKYIPSLRIVPGPILGTMYLPSFSAEVNVLELFRRRIDMLCSACEDAAATIGNSDGRLCISTMSATDLSALPDASVDYVFTDPPFGHNIMYSELNFLWESWLGWRTNPAEEVVVSRSQKKGVSEYGDLMAASFAEIVRVLKPGRWMTLVFHNTQAAVWAEIQRGVAEAGFRIESAQTLDKSHETFKQVTAQGSVGYDVVMNCRKPSTAPGRATRKSPAPSPGASAEQTAAADILRSLLDSAPSGPSKERTARYLHARLTGELVKSGAQVNMSYKDVLRLLKDRFKTDGRYWTT